MASWLLCRESPAHGACGTRALTHPFVSHLGQRGDTQKGAGEKLVDEVRSKVMMRLVWKGFGKKISYVSRAWYVRYSKLVTFCSILHPV